MNNSLRLVVSTFLLLVLTLPAWADFKESALSWQNQAVDTRAIVDGVLKQLDEIGDQGNPVVEELIADAKNWMAKADKMLAKANIEMEQEQYEQASSDYNWAWQDYVKSATAALNANRILTGQ